MLELTLADKEIVDNSYKSFLNNLRDMLKSYSINSDLDYATQIINMLRSGYFSMDGKIIFDDTFKFLYLPNLISRGTQVMCGIACCRHASSLLNDVLQILDCHSSLLYIHIDGDNNWHCLPSTSNANHVTVLLNDNKSEYILDPANGFILRKEKNQKLTSLDLCFSSNFSIYQDSNIESIGKVLKKYYGYKKMGIENIYDDYYEDYRW